MAHGSLAATFHIKQDYSVFVFIVFDHSETDSNDLEFRLGFSLDLTVLTNCAPSQLNQRLNIKANCSFHSLFTLQKMRKTRTFNLLIVKCEHERLIGCEQRDLFQNLELSGVCAVEEKCGFFQLRALLTSPGLFQKSYCRL